MNIFIFIVTFSLLYSTLSCIDRHYMKTLAL